MVDFQRKVSKPADVLVREVDGEAILLNLANESYYTLDNVGYRMFSVLVGSPSIQQAYELLVDEYAVEEEVLAQDLQTLVELLNGLGLVKLD